MISAFDEQSLQITHEGKLALAQLWNVVERSNNQILAGFSENEKKQLTDFLARIQANCSAIIEE